MPDSAAPPLPPQPAPRSARLRLSQPQRIGLPLMALVSLLAVAGVFGERATDRRASGGSLRLDVHFPNRLRYRQRMTLEASVTNTGAGPVTAARIRVDPQYLDRFSGVSLAPHADPDGTVALGTIAPRESRRLTVTLEGEQVGAVRGAVLATDASGDTARIPLISVVFP